MLPGLDLYYADPAQPLTTAREELDDLDHDLFDVWLTLLFFLVGPPAHFVPLQFQVVLAPKSCCSPIEVVAYRTVREPNFSEVMILLIALEAKAKAAYCNSPPKTDFREKSEIASPDEHFSWLKNATDNVVETKTARLQRFWVYSIVPPFQWLRVVSKKVHATSTIEVQRRAAIGGVYSTFCPVYFCPGGQTPQQRN